ncbi:hypothetical protein [Metakosakonia massiliensis]|uniref:Uncharacterized protein n=1 Tax=Phytobacter massiliensis TaxID=1485952 RepID=A0A6N3GYV4_9ENTR|nr:hypothetical protein [Phytobacter massiliensis]
MKHYFISDDGMLLSGIKEITQEIAGSSFFLNPEKTRNFSPEAGDVVVLAVDNSKTRSLLMRVAYKKNCRLLILLDMPVVTTTRNCFPWFAPKKLNARDLLLLLQKAKLAPYDRKRKEVSQKIVDIFTSLGNGYPVEDVVESHKLSAKYIHQAKRDVLYKYGFMSCNSLGVLICRDMLEMKRF